MGSQVKQTLTSKAAQPCPVVAGLANPVSGAWNILLTNRPESHYQDRAYGMTTKSVCQAAGEIIRWNTLKLTYVAQDGVISHHIEQIVDNCICH